MVSLTAFNATIANLERSFPELAATKIPSGLTRLWILALNPPLDVCEGTSFSKVDNIPKRISVRDDLVLIRNLLKYRTTLELFREALKLSRVPGDTEAANAPNLRDALELMTQRVSVENAPFSTKLAVNGQIAQLAITIHPAFRPLGPFFELAVQVVIYRLVRSFLDFHPNTVEALSSIQFLTTNPDHNLLNSLQALMGVRLSFSPEDAVVKIPVDLLCAPNPSHDSGIWAILNERSTVGSRPRKGDLDLLQVEEEIMSHLLKFKKAPHLPELCKEFGMSERTFIRKLSSHSQTLRKLTSKVRRQLAEDLIQDPARSIASISEGLGYSEPSSLVRSFRAWYGLTPQEWRRKQA